MYKRKAVFFYLLVVCSIVFGFSLTAFAYDGLVSLGFGDSITLGYPYLTGYGNGCNCGIYEKYLESMLTGDGYLNLVFNWGSGGESTAGGLARIESNIQTAIYQWGHVDFVLLLEGTNDYDYGFSINTTVFNLGIMIDKVRSHKIIPVLGTLTPDSTSPAKNIPAYNEQIKAMATAKNVILVDHYAAMVNNWSTLTSDGLHPNLQGYDRMARQWFEKMTELLDPGVVVPTAAYFLLLRH